MIHRIPPMFAVLQPMTLQLTGKFVAYVLATLLFFLVMQDHIITYKCYFDFRTIKIFLILSCLLLLATFSIYGIYHVQLFNEYTKIMMHYCAVLFMSFLFLTINKFLHLGDKTNIEICMATGKALS